MLHLYSFLPRCHLSLLLDPTDLAMALPILILATSIIFLYYVQSTWKQLLWLRFERRNSCKPLPSLLPEKTLFALGSAYRRLWFSKNDRRNLSLKEELDLYGYTFRSRSFGKPHIFTADPGNLQAIFSGKFEDFGIQSMRLFAFQPLIGEGIMTTDGDLWARSRALLRPIFSRTKITDFSGLEAHVNRLLELIPKDGSTIDLQPLFARFSLDTSNSFLLGKSLETLSADQSPETTEFVNSYAYAQKGMGIRLQLPQWNIFTRDKKFWTSCSNVHGFIEMHVNRALLHLPLRTSQGPDAKKTALVYELAKETRDRKRIRNELLNVFLPAHDATGILLTNVMFNLCRQPRVWSKLRREILDKAPGPVSYDQVKGLSYLQLVIKETLRLYPAIGSVGRVARRDTILPLCGGPRGTSPIFVRKGDIVRTSFYALHRRKDIYGENAADFHPERWESLKPPPWSFLPCGGGPRACPGQQLGLAEVSYTLVRLLQAFQRVENRDPVFEFVERYKITTESCNGARVALFPT